MTAPRAHSIVADETTAPGVTPDDLLRIADPDAEPATTAPRGFLEEMAAEYSQIVETTVELKLPVPFWSNLVATFHLPSDGSAERLLAAVKAVDGSRDVKQRTAVCAQIADACVALHYKGQLVDQHVGFGPTAAKVLKAPAGSSQADLVWLALKEESEVLGRFAVRLQKWMENPVSRDESQAVDDPFADG